MGRLHAAAALPLDDPHPFGVAHTRGHENVSDHFWRKPLHFSVRPALPDSDRELVEDGELFGPDIHQDEAAANVNHDDQTGCLARKEQKEASSDGLHRPDCEGR